MGGDAGDHPPSVQVEPNVEEWPIFQLGRSRADSVVVERNIEGENGSSLRQRMEVSAPGKYKLPGRFDYDVYSAVLELLEIRGGMPESGYLGFSLHELMLMMGLEPSGRTYGEVRRSLRRIAATVLESDNAFWSNGAHRHISDTFRLWDVSFDSIRDKNGSGARHQIEFGKLFKRSFAEQYLRGLDIDSGRKTSSSCRSTYRSGRTPTSPRSRRSSRRRTKSLSDATSSPRCLTRERAWWSTHSRRLFARAGRLWNWPVPGRRSSPSSS